MRASMTVDTQQLRFVALLRDGREVDLPAPGEEIDRRIVEAMTELRRLLFVPDKGTWFSMRLSAKQETYSVLYDTYHEPPWRSPLDPQLYLRDFEAFPRDVIHRPFWLLDRLRAARPGHFTGSFTVAGRMLREDEIQWADEAAVLLGMSLPPGNHQTTIRYRGMGRYVDLTVGVLNFRMRKVPWEPPARLLEMLGSLREGMYGKGAGTWFTLRLQVHGMAKISLEFDRDHEPRWQAPAPESAYRQELELYPRTPENTPSWLAQRVGLISGPALSVAKPYDDTLPLPGYPNGYPTFIDRPTLPEQERRAVCAYLENAPVVFTGEGGDPDLFDRDGAAQIPRDYRTDGSWVWPASVAYYLRTHEIAPERGLVERIRSRDYQVPDVDPSARDAAIGVIEQSTGKNRK
jgi:hypothetical protein